MPITETSRHAMLDALAAAIGEDEAMTLAEHLPPVGWVEVATKHDLAVLDERSAERFDQVDRRFEEVDRRFEEVDRRFEEVDRRFDQVDHRLDRIDARLDHELGRIHARFDELSSIPRTMILTLVVLVGSIIASNLAAAWLTRP